MLEEEDPRVLKHLDQGDPLVGVLSEELNHEILVLRRCLCLESQLLASLITSDCLLVAPVRRITMHQLVQQDAKGPHIKLMIMVAMIDHLWGHVF